MRWFNFPTGKKNSRLTPGEVVTHQMRMLFLGSSMRENVWIESSPNKNKSTLVDPRFLTDVTRTILLSPTHI